MRGPCCVALVALVGACAKPPPRELVVHAGLVVDGTSAPPRERVKLTLVDGVITAIEDDHGALDVASETRAVIDARKATVLPGLVDLGHALFPEADCDQDERSLAEATRGGLLALAAGTTSLIAVDTQPTPLVQLRRVVGTARHRGPRIFATGAGVEVRVTDADTPVYPRSRVLPMGNAVAAGAAVELEVEGDADVLLIEVGPLGDRPAELEKTLCAALDAGRRHELRTWVRVQDDAGLAAAARCKAHAVSFTSATSATEASLALARTNATTLVLDPATQDLPRILASGVKLGIATGLATCGTPASRLEKTLTGVHAKGLSASALVRAATSDGAAVLGLGEVLGRVAVGYRGDLLVVDGDPTNDVGALTRVREVILDGVVQHPEGTQPALVTFWAWLRVLWD